MFSDWGAKILRSHILMAKKLECKQQKLYRNKFNKDFLKNGWPNYKVTYLPLIYLYLLPKIYAVKLF